MWREAFVIALGVAFLGFVFLCFDRRPARPRRRVFLFVGPEGVEMSSFTINPGQTKTLTAIFADDTGTSEPLSAVPSPSDKSGLLTFSPIGTQTPNDGTYKWSVTCPSTVAPGATFDVSVTASNPDGTPITTGNDIQGSALAPDNTHVSLSIT